MKQFFAPISKINEKTREVHGILALEEVDKEGEIMDYADSKQLFMDWSNGIKKASGGKSVGNLREMHQPIVAGKFTEISFDDENKRILAVAKVSKDSSWKKVMNGELNGFSIYGDPVYRKRDKVNKAIRYAVKPLEGSLVDNPCMHSATFTLVKEDGNEIVAKFAGDKKPIQYWHCRHDCEILHKTEEEASSCAGIVAKAFSEDTKVEEIEELEDDFSNNPSPVSKSMYDVSSLASNIQSLKYLEVGSDENKAKFAKAIKNLFSVLTGMVKDEKESFVSSLNSLPNIAMAVKKIGLDIIKGEEMKVKVSKTAIKNTADDDDDVELELDEKELFTPEVLATISKSVGKSIAKSIGPVIKETINEAVEEALEEQNEVIQALNKAVVKMAGLPKASKTVVKKSKAREEENDDEGEEKPKKVTKVTKTSDRNDADLHRIMKTALRNPIPVAPEDDEEEEEGTEEGEE